MATVATMTITVTKDDQGKVVATIDSPATTFTGLAGAVGQQVADIIEATLQ